MLNDRMLFNDLVEYYAEKHHSQLVLQEFVDSKDTRLAKWLFRCLDNKRVFDIMQTRDIPNINKKELRKLNRISLTGIFQTQIFSDVFFLDYPLYMEKDRPIARLEASGYRCIGEYDVLNNHYFLEFKREQ